MEDNTKILIGVGGLVVVGLGVWLITRPAKDKSKNTSYDGGLIDNSTTATDSLGTQVVIL